VFVFGHNAGDYFNCDDCGVFTHRLAPPGHQSLLVHLRNSGFIILSGDVVHSEENFEKNIVPSLNTDKAESIASMEKIRQMIAMYKAKLFINHDKKQTDTLKLLPTFYD
jgi:N-acyl homoserine lactone hydrolase